MLGNIKRTIDGQQLTVLVTHWWEYFPKGSASEKFIRVLHETADYLAGRRDVKVISFSALARGEAQLN